MDIIAACTETPECSAKMDAKRYAFFQTSIYWILGREWLIAQGKSSDAWTASCVDVVKSIAAGVVEPTTEQQQNLQAAITDAGASYMLAVETAMNGSSFGPPGLSASSLGATISPKTFACFARWLAAMYVVDVSDGGSRLTEALSAPPADRFVDYQCGFGQKEVTDDPIYVLTQPYNVPKGITPSPSDVEPVPPVPKDQPPAPGATEESWLSKHKWHVGLGAAALAVLGGAFYLGSRKHPRRLESAAHSS